MPLQPVAPDQPESVQFMWFYGLHANNCGTYVKKPMPQCSGEEIMRKFLYYCGLEDKIDEIMPHITAIPVVMPYITSQFMPRKLKDRARRSFQRATGTSRSSAGSWSWRAMWCSLCLLYTSPSPRD